MTKFNHNTTGIARLAAMARLIPKVSIGLALSALVITSAAQTSYYYDGGIQRTITPQPNLVAKLTTPATTGTRSTESSANAPFVTINTSGSSRSIDANSSPVYREGGSAAGRLLALPGGVIVNFKPDWSDAQIQAWAATKGYMLGQRLNILGNWYVLPTAAGQIALDIANAIQESGEVVSASPNWWKETVTR
ncbi:MAG: hypothetical protein WCH60_13840 [Burkholderiales bacterium]